VRTAMITPRAVPVLLPAHHRRVASYQAITNDFADPLHSAPSIAPRKVSLAASASDRLLVAELSRRSGTGPG
jgi:hypothetical protein